MIEGKYPLSLIMELRKLSLLLTAAVLFFSATTAYAAETYDAPSLAISGGISGDYTLAISPAEIYHREMGDAIGYEKGSIEYLVSPDATTRVMTPWNNSSYSVCSINTQSIPETSSEANGFQLNLGDSACSSTSWKVFNSDKRTYTYYIKLKKQDLKNYYVAARLTDSSNRSSEPSMFLRFGSESQTLPQPKLTVGQSRAVVLKNISWNTAAIRIAMTKENKAHNRDSFLSRLNSKPEEFITCDVNLASPSFSNAACQAAFEKSAWQADFKQNTLTIKFNTWNPGKNLAIATIDASGQVSTYSNPLILPHPVGYTSEPNAAVMFGYVGNGTIRLYHADAVGSYDVIMMPGATDESPRDYMIAKERGLLLFHKVCHIEAAELVAESTSMTGNCSKVIKKLPITNLAAGYQGYYEIKLTYGDINLDDVMMGIVPIGKNGTSLPFVGPYLPTSAWKSVYDLYVAQGAPTNSNSNANANSNSNTSTSNSNNSNTNTNVNFKHPQLKMAAGGEAFNFTPSPDIATYWLRISKPLKEFSVNSFDAIINDNSQFTTCYLATPLKSGTNVELISYLPGETQRPPCYVDIEASTNNSFNITLSEGAIAYRYADLVYKGPDGKSYRSTPIVSERSAELMRTMPTLSRAEALGTLPFNDRFSISESLLTAVTNMRSLGIMTGYPDGSFKPQNPINRAEFTKLLLLSRYDEAAIRAETASYMAQPCFWDISPYEWYIPYVCFAKKYNIIQGYADGSFKPANAILHNEALKIALLVNDFKETSFPGMSSDWFAGFQETGYELGVFTLVNFTPYTPITREQAAEVIDRITQARNYFGS